MQVKPMQQLKIRNSLDSNFTPLSYGQKGIFFAEKLSSHGISFNIPILYKLEGPLDALKLKSSILKVIDCHSILKTNIVFYDGEPFLIDRECKNLESEFLKEFIFSNPKVANKKQMIDQIIISETTKPFDLMKGPLCRFALIQSSPQEHYLFFVIHHIICDGWSVSVILKDILSNYSGKAQLLEIDNFFKKFKELESITIAQLNEEKQSYWQCEIEKSGPLLNLPYLNGKENLSLKAKGSVQKIPIQAELLPIIEKFCSKEMTTPFAVFMAIYAYLLSKLSTRDVVTLGVPMTQRYLEGIEMAVGYFVNTLPLVIEVDENKSFLDLLAHVKQKLISAQKNLTLPFEYALEKNKTNRRFPFYQTLFVQDGSIPEKFHLDDVKISHIPVHNQSSKTELSLILSTDITDPHLTIEYQSNLFSDRQIKDMLSSFVFLSNNLLENPSQTLKDTCLGEGPYAMIYGDERDYDRNKDLYQYFEENATEHSEKIAIQTENTFLTYQEFLRNVSERAINLEALGIKQGTPVGLLQARGIDAVINMFALFKIGALYVPLDPQQPEHRLMGIIKEAKIEFLLTEERMLSDLPLSITQVLLDSLKDSITQNKAFEKRRSISPSSTAYVIYTSGSTGEPKGVAVSHESLLNTIISTNEVCGFKTGETFIAVTSLTFDVSLLDYFLPISVGGKVILAPPQFEKDPNTIINHIENEGDVAIQGTPSFWELLLSCRSFETERLVCLTAGEALTESLKRRLLSKGSVYNFYGPTEAAVYSTYQAVQSNQQVTIGVPLPNTELYIAKENGKLCIEGEPGELYIGGFGLSSGYLNREELTEERFIINPFDSSGSGRLYKTGDLGRLLPDGNIEFLGRIDNQVKIRGHRVELGEVEAALLKLESVKAAVVIFSEGTLLAYIVPEKEFCEDNLPVLLEKELKMVLPEYMLPQAYIMLESLPLSPNGKVDRKGLPQVDRINLTQDRFVPPETPTELAVADIWKELLKIEDIGKYDNFFQVGGHSLLAVQMLNKAQKTFQCPLSLKDFFEYPTLSQMARRIEESHKEEVQIIPKVPEGTPIPLSYTQQRVWFLQNLLPQKNLYHIPFSVKLSGDLNVQALEKALCEIANRHDILRTHVIEIKGVPYQKVASPFEDVKVPCLKCKNSLHETLLYHSETPFDLEKDILFRPLLLDIGNKAYIFAITFHHLVMDGWSLGLFCKELAHYYNREITQQETSLHSLPIQFSDFAIWQKEHEEDSLEYWKAELEAPPALSTFPSIYSRPEELTYQGETFSFTIPEPLFDKLKILSEAEGVSLFTTMLTSFMTLLYRYTQQEDLIIGLPVANRPYPELESLIGFFTNTIAFRMKSINGTQSFNDLQRKLHKKVIEDLNHQQTPFEKIVDALDLPRMLNANPLFQVMFSYQAKDSEEINLEGLTCVPYLSPHKTSKFDTNFFIQEHEAHINILIEYTRDLYDGETIERIGENYLHLLSEIVEKPNEALGALEVVTPREQHYLLHELNNQWLDIPEDKCTHHLVEEQVERNPEGVALCFEEETMSYGTLNERSNQLAHLLQREGVTPETPVGIALERSFDMVISVLAVLKAGGAYVPLDPSYPEERLIFQLEDTDSPIVITDQVEKFRRSYKGKCIHPEDAKDQPKGNPKSKTKPHNLAYIIYTSGSTGKPKGVAIEHLSVINFLSVFLKDICSDSVNSVAALTPLTFDISIFELFWPLCKGKKIIIYPQVQRVLNKLNSMKLDEDIIQATPTVFALLLETGWKPSSNSIVIVGGEVLTSKVCDPLLKNSKLLLNVYGPTEATIWTTCENIIEKHDPTIGKPFFNYTLYIANDQLSLQPIGTPGEIFIGGQSVARGYIGDGNSTNDAFIPNPFTSNAKPLKINNSRVYRTGDYGRRLIDGRIEFLGRRDSQIKIQGHRIEMQEIEIAISSCIPGIPFVLINHSRLSSPKELNLYINLTGNEQRKETAQSLRENLKRQLPSFMIPSHIFFVDEFPLTTSGKIDIKKVVEIAEVVHSHPSLNPKDSIEFQLMNLWQHHFNKVNISIDDNFFEMGGTSLSAIIFLEKISTQFGTKVPFYEFYKSPTIETLASLIQKERANDLPVLKISNQEGPNLFLMHPASGLCTDYLPLEIYLSDINVLGINNPFFADLENEFQSIESMANYYCKIIKKIQPYGPYNLGGWSFGGNVAFEIARQLKNDGEKIQNLLIFDSVNLANQVFEVNESDVYLEPGLSKQDAEGNTIFTNEVLKHMQLLKAYDPGNYDGPFTLFKATKGDIAKEYHGLDETNGWSAIVKGTIRVYKLPMAHADMFNEGNIELMSDKIKETITEKNEN